jgi:hypothetical protein
MFFSWCPESGKVVGDALLLLRRRLLPLQVTHKVRAAINTPTTATMIPISSALLSLSPSREDELVLPLFPLLLVDEEVCSGPFVIVITDVTPLMTICVLITPCAVVQDSFVVVVTASDVCELTREFEVTLAKYSVSFYPPLMMTSNSINPNHSGRKERMQILRAAHQFVSTVSDVLHVTAGLA